MNNVQKEFENEYTKIHSTLVRFDKDSYFAKDDEGYYMQDNVYSAYYWWCKSRENLVVDLPNKLPYNQHDLDFKRIYAAGFNDALKSCTDKLQDLCINIK